jgi:hypothetical protein
VVTAGIGLFLTRGLYRAIGRSSDYAWNYLSTRAWLHGTNPYDLQMALAQRPADFPASHVLEGIVTPYPPAVFPLTAPFAAMAWTSSTGAFVAVSAILWLLALRSLGQQFQLPPVRRRLFYGLALAAYPIQTALSLGQYSAPAIAVLILAWCVSRQERDFSAAVLGCICLALKPQIGAIFLAIVLLERRWKLSALMLSGYGALTAAGMLPVLLGGVSIGDLREYLGSVRAVYDQQSQQFCCINLRMITRNATGKPGLNWAIEILVLLGLTSVLLIRARTGRLFGPLLFVAVYVLFLLAMYHRPYDLAGLVVALVWVCSRVRLDRADIGIAICLLMFVQPIPTLALLGTLTNANLISLSNAGGRLDDAWQFLVIPHTTWMLVALFAFASVGWRRERPETPSSTRLD